MSSTCRAIDEGRGRIWRRAWAARLHGLAWMLVLAGIPSMAWAVEPSLQPPIRQKLDVRANEGFASAVGFFGLTCGYSPTQSFQIEAGFGWGITGLQFSLMPKYSLGSAKHRFVVGAGPSLGYSAPGTGMNGEFDDADFGPGGCHRCTAWFNGEIGYEYRSKSHVSLLLAFGFTVGLAGVVPDTAFGGGFSKYRDVAGFVFPQTRAAIGFWL